MRISFGRIALPGGRRCFAAAILMAAVSTGLVAGLYNHEAVLYADGAQYYLEAARFAATGSLLPEDPPSPVTPYGEELTVRGTAIRVWMYPPGMAILLLAPVIRLLGPAAAFAVVPALAFLTLVAFYILCARLVRGPAALLALLLAILMPCRNALFPSFLSHATCAFLLVLGLVFAEGWFRTGEGRPAAACGVTFGLIPAFRYPETVYLLAVGLAALLQVFGRRIPGRSLLVFCAGAAIPIALLALHNTILMGGPFRTGYSTVGANRDFSGYVFRTNAFPYVELLFHQFGPHLLLATAAGFAAMCRTEAWRWLARAMLLISASTVLLYTAYLWAADLRYVMPLIYPVILAAVFFLERLRDASATLYRPVAAAVVVLSLVPAAQHFDSTMPVWEREGRIIETLVGEVRERCPEGSALVACTPVAWTLNVMGDYEIVLTETLDSADCREDLALLLDRHRSFYVLDSREAEDWLGRCLPAGTAVDTLLRVRIDDGGGRVVTLPTLIMTALGDVRLDLLRVRPAPPDGQGSRGTTDTLLIDADSRRLRFLPPVREPVHADEP